MDGVLPGARPLELIEDHWLMQFGNLAMHLLGGVIFRPDFTDPSPEIHLAVGIAAPPAQVFRALIEPALIDQWFGSKGARVEPKAGGAYLLGWKYEVDGRDVVGGTTRILEYVDQEQLVLDWLDWRGDPTVTGQWISFALAPDGPGTRLRFVHGGFSRTSDIGDYPFGWADLLEGLRKVVLSAV